MIGRDRTVAGIIALLQTPGVRWVSLTGPGGVGKTRVAMSVAEELSQGAGDRVRWVDLARTDGSAEVLPAIANAVGLQESSLPGETLPDRLAELLAVGYWLLVLDNLEHVLDAAPLVVDLLRAAPGVTVLATSRTQIRLGGEYPVLIEPLPLPPARGTVPVDAALATPAVALFVRQARSVAPGFAATPDSIDEIVAICAALDGLPLAIELAAARLNRSTLAELRAELTERLALLDRLQQPSDESPARQQSLRAVFDWSCALLTPAARTLFARLSVCLGGFDADLAVAVGGESGGTPSAPISGALTELERASLIRRATVDGQSRWSMLATARAYATELLRATGDEGATMQRLAAWCLRRAEAAAGAAFLPAQDQILNALELERPNLSVALDWLDRQAEIETYVTLAGQLRTFWFLRSHYDEGTRILARAAEIGGDCSTLLRGRIRQGLAMLALAQQDAAMATADFATAHDLLLGGGAGSRELAIGSLGRSTAAAILGDVPAAIAHQEAALATVIHDDPIFHEAMAIAAVANLALLTGMRGDRGRAAVLFDEAQARQEATGVTWYLAILWRQRGTVAEHHGELPAARDAYRASLEVSLERHRDLRLVAEAIAGLASVACTGGEMERSARLLGAEETMRLRAGGVAHRTIARVATIRETVSRALSEKEFARLTGIGAAYSEVDLLVEARGGTVTPVAESSPSDVSTGKPAVPEGVLTPMLTRVLVLMAAGMTNAEIARAIISPRTKKPLAEHTVERHVSNIFTRLGVQSRAEATAYAVRAGLA